MQTFMAVSLAVRCGLGYSPASTTTPSTDANPPIAISSFWNYAFTEWYYRTWVWKARNDEALRNYRNKKAVGCSAKL